MSKKMNIDRLRWLLFNISFRSQLHFNYTKSHTQLYTHGVRTIPENARNTRLVLLQTRRPQRDSIKIDNFRF